MGQDMQKLSGKELEILLPTAPSPSIHALLATQTSAS